MGPFGAICVRRAVSTIRSASHSSHDSAKNRWDDKCLLEDGTAAYARDEIPLFCAGRDARSSLVLHRHELANASLIA